MSIDTGPLLNHKVRPVCVNQESHIYRFNRLGKVMVAMSDLYNAGKNATPEVIQSLRRDFQKSWVISSTRINYELNNLEAAITHYFGSKIVSPEEVKVVVPDYSNSPTLDQVLSNEEGLKYLQALFNTSDDTEAIKRTLKRLSGKDGENTVLWTPNQYNRIKYQDRVVLGLSFYNRFGLFRVDCINYNHIGRSRAVLDSSK